MHRHANLSIKLETDEELIPDDPELAAHLYGWKREENVSSRREEKPPKPFQSARSRKIAATIKRNFYTSPMRSVKVEEIAQDSSGIDTASPLFAQFPTLAAEMMAKGRDRKTLIPSPEAPVKPLKERLRTEIKKTCPHCNFISLSESPRLLRKHIREKHRKQFRDDSFSPHACTQAGCDYRTFNASSLFHHRKNLHGKAFEKWEKDGMFELEDTSCSFCTERITSLEQLRNHIEEHDDEINKSGPFIKCRGCDEQFAWVHDIFEHWRKGRESEECLEAGIRLRRRITVDSADRKRKSPGVSPPSPKRPRRALAVTKKEVEEEKEKENPDGVRLKSPCVSPSPKKTVIVKKEFFEFKDDVIEEIEKEEGNEQETEKPEEVYEKNPDVSPCYDLPRPVEELIDFKDQVIVDILEESEEEEETDEKEKAEAAPILSPGVSQDSPKIPEGMKEDEEEKENPEDVRRRIHRQATPYPSAISSPTPSLSPLVSQDADPANRSDPVDSVLAARPKSVNPPVRRASTRKITKLSPPTPPVSVKRQCKIRAEPKPTSLFPPPHSTRSPAKKTPPLASATTTSFPTPSSPPPPPLSPPQPVSKRSSTKAKIQKTPPPPSAPPPSSSSTPPPPRSSARAIRKRLAYSPEPEGETKAKGKAKTPKTSEENKKSTKEETSGEEKKRTRSFSAKSSEESKRPKTAEESPIEEPPVLLQAETSPPPEEMEEEPPVLTREGTSPLPPPPPPVSYRRRSKPTPPPPTTSTTPLPPPPIPHLVQEPLTPCPSSAVSLPPPPVSSHRRSKIVPTPLPLTMSKSPLKETAPHPNLPSQPVRPLTPIPSSVVLPPPPPPLLTPAPPASTPPMKEIKTEVKEEPIDPDYEEVACKPLIIEGEEQPLFGEEVKEEPGEPPEEFYIDTGIQPPSRWSTRRKKSNPKYTDFYE